MCVYATFEDSDDLVEQLRRRMAYIGMSFGVLDEILGVEGAAGKYLSPLRVRRITAEALLKITAAVGLKPLLVVDDKWHRIGQSAMRQRPVVSGNQGSDPPR
jgi:hypothetical protein